MSALGVFAVVDFDEDSGLLEAEAVGGGEDVVSAVGSGWGDAGAVAHGSQDASHKLLHLFPVEAADGVFDEGVGFAQDLLAKLVFEGPFGGFFTFGRDGGKVEDSGHSLKIGFEVVDGVGWDFEESLNGPQRVSGAGRECISLNLAVPLDGFGVSQVDVGNGRVAVGAGADRADVVEALLLVVGDDGVASLEFLEKTVELRAPPFDGAGLILGVLGSH